MADRGNLLRDFWTLICFLLVWFGFQVLDPFSSESATRRASQDFFSAVAAPFYGMAQHPARDGIAVVEITDTTLDTLHHAWPLPYSSLALYLDAILDASPKAVFVDIEFARQQPGGSLEDFADTLARADERHIPILFAGGGVADQLPEPLRDRGTVMRWVGEPGLYPLVVEPANGGHAEPHAKPRELAAFDLYARLCAAGRLTRCDAIVPEEVVERPLLVRWGAAMPPEQPDVSNTAGCWQGQPGSVGALGHAAALAFNRFLPGVAIKVRQPCFYELTIGAEQLSHTTASGRPVDGLLTDRVVFLGADLVGGHDVTPAPPFGLVSGTQLHAMAFDNLVTYGADYFHAPRAWKPLPWFEITETTLFGAVAWVVALFGFATDRSLQRRHAAALIGAAILLAAVVDVAQRWGQVSRSGLITVIILYITLAAGTLAVWVPRRIRAERATNGWWRRCGSGAVHFGRLLTLVAGFATVNELLPRWPPTDWFGLVLLALAMGEASETQAGRHEPRLVDNAIGAVRRLKLLLRPKESHRVTCSSAHSAGGPVASDPVPRTSGRHGGE